MFILYFCVHKILEWDLLKMFMPQIPGQTLFMVSTQVGKKKNLHLVTPHSKVHMYCRKYTFYI